MQHSSQVLFCEECGLANDVTASQCAACQHPLNTASSEPGAPSPVPVPITPPRLEVTASSPSAQSWRSASASAISGYPPCSFQKGSILAGRYQIEAEIGRGGFSTVYRAIDLQNPSSGYRVAIKRIQLGQLTPRQVIDATETFNREVLFLSHIRDVKGIPTYCGHLTDSENWYLITTYIKGRTLEDHLRKARGGYLKENEALLLGIKLAKTLQSLHAHGPNIIFRDVKPANIMLTPIHEVFLIDFGIARIFTPGKTKDTTPLGSPGYAPPEQYGRAQTDPRSDIYSLGATLQTLLTGREPLELNDGELPRNPRPLRPDLQQLLNEMLASDPAQRPPDMATVQKRLEAILYRPRLLFLSGLLFVFILCIIGAIVSPLTSTALFGNFSWIVYIFIMGFVSLFIQGVLKLPAFPPKGHRGYWRLGLFTAGAIVVAIGALWQVIQKIW